MNSKPEKLIIYICSVPWISLLLTKSKLEEVLLGPEEALASCREMMKLWKDIHEIDSEE